jgi:hypothetical protein
LEDLLDESLLQQTNEERQQTWSKSLPVPNIVECAQQLIANAVSTWLTASAF